MKWLNIIVLSRRLLSLFITPLAFSFFLPAGNIFTEKKKEKKKKKKRKRKRKRKKKEEIKKGVHDRCRLFYFQNSNNLLDWYSLLSYYPIRHYLFFLTVWFYCGRLTILSLSLSLFCILYFILLFACDSTVKEKCFTWDETPY